jgi:hypothetical protein
MMLKIGELKAMWISPEQLEQHVRSDGSSFSEYRFPQTDSTPALLRSIE